MKSLLVLAICFAVSVKVAPLPPGKRDEAPDDSPGQFTVDDVRKLKALLKEMAVKKNTTNSPIFGSATPPNHDGQNPEITPTATTTRKPEGDNVLDTKNHSKSTELRLVQKEKSPKSKLAEADIQDSLLRLSVNVKKLTEVLKSRENTPGSQETTTKSEEDNAKLTPEDEMATPNVTENPKGTTTTDKPSKAVKTTVTETSTANPTTKLKVEKAKLTTVKPTTNVTVMSKKITTDVTTTLKEPTTRTATLKSTKEVTKATKARTLTKPTTKATKTTTVAKPSTKVTVTKGKKATDKTLIPTTQVNNGKKGTNTVNGATTKEPDGGATPSITAASKLSPGTWVKSNSYFPMVLMVAISLTVFLAMGYYNRRKIQNTIKKTCNVKQKTDHSYVKVKLEDDNVELPRDANREYVY